MFTSEHTLYRDNEDWRRPTDTDVDYEGIFWLVYSQEKIPTSDFAVPILSVFGVLINLLVLVISLTSPKLLRTRTTYLVISLSIADLCICGLVMPITFALRYAGNIQPGTGLSHSQIWCAFWLFLITMTCTASSLNISAITIDRYLFITSPLHYELKMTRFRMLQLLLLVWISSLVLGIATSIVHTFLEGENHKTKCLREPGPKYSFFMAIIVLFVPMFILIVLYLRIYKVIREHRRVMRRHQSIAVIRVTDVGLFKATDTSVDGGTRRPVNWRSSFDAEITTAESTTSSGPAPSSRLSRARRLWSLRSSSAEIMQNYLIAQDTKSSVILCLVVGTYMVCWLPFAVIVAVNVFFAHITDYRTREIILYMGYSNSCWNPLIYGGLNQAFRESVYHFCQRFSWYRRPQNRSFQRSADPTLPGAQHYTPHSAH